MIDAPDADLLEQFVRDHSEAAFATLVERHIGIVHAVALRHTANSQHAEDITQAVFIILARKAATLGRKTILPGWLYHTARLTAANYQRAEIRRIRREQEVFMESTLQEPAPDPLWPELSPLLDDAMSHLRADDRDALVLRYFQNRSLAEVGAVMGLAERTAQKRILRAIEKLRKIFAKQGVTSTTDQIVETISASSVLAVSPVLAKTVATTAFAKGVTASASILTLTKGALKIMAWTKAKTAVVAGTVLILVAGTTTVIVKHSGNHPQTIPPKMELRVYKITPDIFFSHLSHELSPKDGETRSQLLARFFKEQHVDIQKPPDSLFVNDEKGLVIVRASSPQQAAVERLVGQLNNP